MVLDVVNLFLSVRGRTWRQGDLFGAIFLFYPPPHNPTAIFCTETETVCIIKLDHEKQTVGRKRLIDLLGGSLVESSMTFSQVLQASAV